MISEVENKYVIFKLKEEYYGIPIANVLSIERIEEITRVPNAPKYVMGVINLRGEVIPLVDLGMRLDIDAGDYNRDSRIIVTSVDDIIAGLVVDSSSEVLEIDKDSIDPPPDTNNGRCIEFLNGVGKIDNRLIILLNLPKVLEY
ncbi:MAG: chemotaxis protein CheW [Tissierellia bacterium]|nr:chemotaxis protein CheW [Tissierellia bacterium]